MEILPAIDLKNGEVVRLVEGDYNNKTTYFTDPLEILDFFIESGSKYLHVVDLDGASDGETVNFKTIEKIIKKCDLFVEVGGGIRSEDTIRKYLDIGVKRTPYISLWTVIEYSVTSGEKAGVSCLLSIVVAWRAVKTGAFSSTTVSVGTVVSAGAGVVVSAGTVVSGCTVAGSSGTSGTWRTWFGKIRFGFARSFISAKTRHVVLNLGAIFVR